MRFLLTRPQPECARTASALRAKGHHVLEAPMLVLQSRLPNEFELDGVEALAVTSKRVADLIESHPQIDRLRRLPVYTVGDKTAEGMRSAGFARVFSADGDVVRLGDMIAAHAPQACVLYLAAQERSGGLELDLGKRGLRCMVEVVYAMKQQERLGDEAIEALARGEVDGVLIYSRRTGEAFVAALMSAGRMDLFQDLPVFAISRQSAAVIPANACVKVASHPSEEALLEQALSSC